MPYRRSSTGIPRAGGSRNLEVALDWFRVESVFHECEQLDLLKTENPKLFEKAITMWLFSGLFCARTSSDGRIRRNKLAELVPTIRRPKAVIQALIDCGLLSESEDDSDALAMPNYTKYNPSRAEKDKWKGQGRARQETFRQRKSNAVTNELQGRGCNGAPVLSLPVPSLPDPPSPDLRAREDSPNPETSEPDPPHPLEDDLQPLKHWREGDLTWLTVVAAWVDLAQLGELIEPSLQREAAESIARRCQKLNPTEPRDAIEKVIKAWLADDYVRQNRPVLAHLAKQFHKYGGNDAGPAPPKNDMERDELETKLVNAEARLRAAESDHESAKLFRDEPGMESAEELMGKLRKKIKIMRARL